ncbi:TIGR04255 family protein [Klebsiella sp. Ap-873]|nr:TIGR04255 family protein [Klebsiella sp. Ap-873]
MAKHLNYVLSKIEYGRISKTKFMEGMDLIIEALRRDFPNVLPLRQQNSFRFELKAEGGHEVFTDVDPVLTLLSSNKAWGIRIAPNFIILHTRKCEGFIDFRDKIMKVIEAVYRNFDITHISFVGIRYLNSFDYSKEYEFSDCYKRLDFLQPSIDKWMKGGSNLSARYVIEADAINVSSGVMINAPKYMPDLAELASDIDDVNKINEGPVAHLDIDSFFDANELVEFSMSFISEKIDTLRYNANSAYKEIII